MAETTSQNAATLSDPIPTKFFVGDLKILQDATQNAGLSRSEIIRRAVRLLGRQKDVVNGYEFLLRLTA